MSEQDTSDARLVAFLDGQLSDAEAQALEAELAHDPALSARLEALDMDLSGLRGAMDRLAATAPPPPSLPERRTGSLMQLAAAACVALALVLGGVLLGARGGQPSEDWRDFAAAYHLLYRPETLATPLRGDGGVAEVSRALGHDLQALAEVEGLDFRRAQVLGWEDQVLVQFAYLDARGRPVAVCVMAAASASEDIAVTTRHGLPTATLQSGAVEVLVIGAEGMEGVDTLAQAIAARL